MESPENSTLAGTLANAAAARKNARYVLRLYIISTTPRSMRAVANIRRICDEYLPGRYELEVFDLAQHPALAEREQIIAAPTLVKLLPPPPRRFIGDLSETEQVLLGLDLCRVEGNDDVQERSH